MTFRLISIIVFFVLSHNLYPQFTSNGSNPVLVKGMVTFEKSGEPVGATIVFKDSKGKKIKIKSNSKYGNFEQLLEASENYTVTLSSPNMVRLVEQFRVKDSDGYTEQEKNFKVTKLEPGVGLLSVDGFGSSNQILNAIGKESLTEMQQMLKFNRSLWVQVKVSAHDTYTKAPVIIEEPKKKSKKRRKKAAKQVKPPDPDPDLIRSLVDNRINEIKKLFEENEWKRYLKRIEVVGDYSMAPAPSSGSTVNSNPDLVILVKDIKSVFE